MTFLFETHGNRWSARQGSGPDTDIFFYWPNDFPGYPANPTGNTDQVVLVDRIKLVMTTVVNIANRRPRLRLINAAGNKVIEWHAGVTTGTGVAGAIYQFTQSGVFTDLLVGGVARTHLPTGIIMMAGWALELDIIGLVAGDSIDEVAIGGSFEG